MTLPWLLKHVFFPLAFLILFKVNVASRPINNAPNRLSQDYYHRNDRTSPLLHVMTLLRSTHLSWFPFKTVKLRNTLLSGYVRTVKVICVSQEHERIEDRFRILGGGVGWLPGFYQSRAKLRAVIKMTFGKPIPKLLLRPIKTGANCAMNQSEFLALAVTCSKRKEITRTGEGVDLPF